MASLNKMADLAGLRLVVFRAAELVCAADVAAVREILPAYRATRIPGASAAIAGLINVRGELVPLVHGAQLLGRTSDPTGGGQTLLLAHGAGSVAVSVDEVLDLFALAEDDLADRRELPGIDPKLVRAVGQREGRSFLVLDLDALLGPILTS